MKSKSNKPNSSGFTIMELLIASAVFSVTLLVALAGFLEIGRLFYKGVTSAQSQDITQQIVSDVAANLKLADGPIPYGSTPYTYNCAGGTRYTFNIDQEVDRTVGQNLNPPGMGGNFGLLSDQLPSGTVCSPPCYGGGQPGCVAFNKPTEMLGDKMRLTVFDIINPITGDSTFHIVNVMTVFGDDDVLDYDSPSGSKDPSTERCKGGVSSEFCGTYKLTASTRSGVAL